MSGLQWIKPSFLWMMYRCGWTTKPDQEDVLAIRLRRDGFEWALQHAALSHYDRDVHPSREGWVNSRHLPVRLQWDPERNLRLQPLPYRSLQIGLSGEAVHRYLTDWITGIDDITGTVRTVGDLVAAAQLDQARSLLPVETPYHLPADLAKSIGCSVNGSALQARR